MNRLNWPNDPVELAKVAADPATSAADFHRAIVELTPYIRETALAVANRFRTGRRQDCHDLVDQSVSHIAEKISRFGQTGAYNLDAWLRQVLVNLLRDIRDKRKKKDPLNRAVTGQYNCESEETGVISVDHWAGEGAAATSVDQIDQPAKPTPDDGLEKRLWKVNEELQRVNWKTGSRVNYQAVFLLDFRIRFCLALRAAFGHQHFEPEDLLQKTQHHVPWTAEQAQLCPRRDWQPIGEIWDRIQMSLTAPNVTVGSVIQRINSQLPEDRQISEDVWKQWTCRARRQVRDQIGEQQWSEHFLRLLGASHG